MVTQSLSSPAERPRLTVAAIAERDGRFLLVEERTTTGGLVFNQPAGHVETGESLLEAVVRETFEETAWRFIPEFLVGIYLWQHPSGQSSYLRVCFAGQAIAHDPAQPLDDGIERALWLSRQELDTHSTRMRSPLVMRTVDDYLAGEHYPLALLKSLLS